MSSTKPLKIFHSIICDMSSMIDDLRDKQTQYDELVEENELLKRKLKRIQLRHRYENFTLYFLVTSLSICLALPPIM